MRKFLLMLAAALGAGLPAAACADGVFVGGAPAYQEIESTYRGKPVTLVQMAASYHEMDLPPHHVQIIGFIEYFYVLKEKPDYEADRCEQWVTQVLSDEAGWSQDNSMYPYFEIDIAAHAKRIKIGGDDVYRARDVLCWEAMDLGPPRY